MKSTASGLLTLAFLAFNLSAQAQSKDGADEAVQKNAEAFVAAFNKGDAAALAEFWTADADYVDQAGRTVKGKKNIEKNYEKLFAERKGAKLFINVTSRRFLKPDLAIEDGITEVLPADGGPPTNARYTAVHIKQDGQWLLASVRESVPQPPSNFEHLEALEWLVGDWEDEAEKGASAKFSYSWAENKNFLVASFATTLNNVPVAGGTQWIGWDAAGKQVRSWAFDASGGFGEGLWSRDGKAWSIKSTITTRDGQKITATNIVTKVDADHFTWQSTKRAADGKPIPDTEVVKLKRLKAK
jgi:uncharacterized protein (TIGR02246 family)